MKSQGFASRRKVGGLVRSFARTLFALVVNVASPKSAIAIRGEATWRSMALSIDRHNCLSALHLRRALRLDQRWLIVPNSPTWQTLRFPRRVVQKLQRRLNRQPPTA